jgi:hypothetical protein
LWRRGISEGWGSCWSRLFKPQAPDKPISVAASLQLLDSFRVEFIYIVLQRYVSQRCHFLNYLGEKDG